MRTCGRYFVRDFAAIIFLDDAGTCLHLSYGMLAGIHVSKSSPIKCSWIMDEIK